MLCTREITVCDAPSDLSVAACRKLLKIVDDADPSRYPLSLALSGGTTPRALYELLHRDHLPLLRDGRALRFFFGDERLVPAGAAESNGAMARAALLRDVPADLVVPVAAPAQAEAAALAQAEGGAAAAEAAAEAYERRLRAAIGAADGEAVVFDVVLLGLGADGHTASIFPGSQAARETERAVSIGFPSPAMSPKVWRVTLTPPVIKQARHVIVMASGEEKNWVVKGIMHENPEEELPVARFLRECQGEVTFILDKAAFKDVVI